MVYHYRHSVPGLSAEDLFDLVLDVEGYPSFVPGWEAVRIRDRGDETYRTEQIVRTRLFRQRIQSVTTYRRPDRIDVVGKGDLLKRFNLCWQFEPSDEGCDIGLSVEVGASVRPLQGLIEASSREASRTLIGVFVAEAERRYGERASACGRESALAVVNSAQAGDGMADDA